MQRMKFSLFHFTVEVRNIHLSFHYNQDLCTLLDYIKSTLSPISLINYSSIAQGKPLIGHRRELLAVWAVGAIESFPDQKLC